MSRLLDSDRRGPGGGAALAVGVLDVRRPGGRDERQAVRHWCLAHYLLDGHHKVYAAAREARTVRLLSLVAADEGSSTAEDLDRALAALRR
ncbi:MAG: hypothetical protein ABR521_11590 [Gaiellaceae bacterium]